MSSLVAQFLTGIAASPTSGAGGASASAAQDAGAFQALLVGGSAAPIQRPANTQIGRVPANPEAADGQAADPAAMLRAARLGLDLDGAGSSSGPDAGTAGQEPAPDGESPVAGPELSAEAGAQAVPTGAALPDPAQSAAPGEGEARAEAIKTPEGTGLAQAVKAQSASKGTNTQSNAAPKTGGASNSEVPTKGPSRETVLTESADGMNTTAAPQEWGAPAPTAVVDDASSVTAKPGDMQQAAPAAATGSRPGASEAAQVMSSSSEAAGADALRSGDVKASSAAKKSADVDPRVPAAKAPPAASSKLDAVQPQPAEPRPAGQAVDAAADQAVFKRAASEAAVEALPRDGRGVSEIAAARAPGEQVRSAARAAGADTKADKADLVSKVTAPAPGVEASAPKPASPAPAITPPSFAAAMMNSAGAAPLATAMDAGADLTGESEADLSLEVSAPRSDARAEVQRQSLPQAANAHAAARFQPQTVQTLAARIAARAVEGGRVFDIRLDPAELGRVEVRLEMGADNSVRALLSAERADTLAELQRSARDLEKALAEAGLDLAEDGLSFSLSDDGAQARDEGAEPRFTRAAWSRSESLTVETSTPAGPLRLYGFELAARRGLDVRT